MYFIGYMPFFSALIVTIRTDLDAMLISRYATLFLTPLAPVLSTLKLLPITPLQSILGMLFSFSLLTSIAYLFRRATNKDGIGQGDIELLTCIGAFTGITGAWFSLFIGSFVGSCIGLIYAAFTKTVRNLKIPFGPFLALGALLYVLFQYPLKRFCFTSCEQPIARSNQPDHPE